MRRRFQVRLALIGVALAAFSVLSIRAVSSQTGTLSAIQTLSEPGQETCCVTLAVDAVGNATFVWRVRHPDGWPLSGVRLRTRSASGVLGGVETITGPRGATGDADVGIDADGNAIVMWSHTGRVFLRARSAGGALAPVERVAVGAYQPNLVVDASGDATVTWSGAAAEGGGSRVYGRRRSASGGLGRRWEISGVSYFPPQHRLAGGAGTATAMWILDPRAQFSDPVETRTWSMTDDRGPTQTVADAAYNVEPSLAVGPDGRVVFAWTRERRRQWGNVYFRVRAPDGTLTRTSRLSSISGNYPQVAVAADGTAVFAWLGEEDWRGVHVRTLSADGTLGAVRAVTDAGMPFGAPLLGVDAAGHAVVAWNVTPAGSIVDWYIEARTRSAAGDLGPVQRIARGWSLRLAIAPNGTAVFAWLWNDGVDWRVRTRTLTPG